jgi:hypothetical protein
VNLSKRRLQKQIKSKQNFYTCSILLAPAFAGRRYGRIRLLGATPKGKRRSVMLIRRDTVLITLVICLLTATGCSTTGGGVHIGGKQPRVVAAPSGPPAHAPAHGYRAKHHYRYYPREQVYFDPGRKVFFYLDGPNWRMAASLPRPQQVNLTYFVLIETNHEKPYLEFDKHKTKYPKHKDTEKKKKIGNDYKGEKQPKVGAATPGSTVPAPAHDRAKHQYRYYPGAEVYFDPGRQVFFYLDGPNWRMGASLPGSLRVNLAHFVHIEMDHEKPYLEFEKHKTKYPKQKDKENKKKRN